MNIAKGAVARERLCEAESTQTALRMGMHTQKHTYICLYIHMHMCIYVYEYSEGRCCAGTSVRGGVYTDGTAHGYVYTHTYICLCMHMHIYMYIYIYI